MTLFQADFRASRFPWLESVREKTMIVTYGRKCSELSGSLRLIGWLVRTCLESCELPPGRWQRIWSVRAITSRCLILKLRLSALGTDGNESLLWHTPNTPNGGCVNPIYMSGTGKMQNGKKRQVRLEHQVRMCESGLWPTPRAMETHSTWQNSHGKKMLTLNGMVRYSTPQARDYRVGSKKRWENKERRRNLNDKIAGQLNPEWVEWLMGFPIGWTESRTESQEPCETCQTE